MQKAKLLFILLSLVLAGTLAGAAQGSIDDVINSLEKKKDVETTYSERRTAKDHKLYRITQVLTFYNQEYYAKAERAFENERNKTVSATKNNNFRTYKFENKNGSSSYTLTRDGNGMYTLVKAWRSANDYGDDDTSSTWTEIDRTPGGCASLTVRIDRMQARQKALAKRQRSIMKRQQQLNRRHSKARTADDADARRQMAAMEAELQRRAADLQRQADRLQQRTEELHNTATGNSSEATGLAAI